MARANQPEPAVFMHVRFFLSCTEFPADIYIYMPNDVTAGQIVVCIWTTSKFPVAVHIGNHEYPHQQKKACQTKRHTLIFHNIFRLMLILSGCNSRIIPSRPICTSV